MLRFARTLRRGRRIAVGATSAFVLIFPGISPAVFPDRIVSRDPYTNTNAFHETEVEPDTFAVGSTFVAAFQMGRFVGPGATNLGFAISSDQGATWTDGSLPGTTTYADPPGPYIWVSEPGITYDAMHEVWLISGIGELSFEHDDAFVSRSTDGMTWSEPATFATAYFGGGKPGVTCDNWSSSPYYGHCYAFFDDQFDVRMLTSIDGGLTWREASLSGNPQGSGGTPVVQPDGTVVVVLDDEYVYPCCTIISRNGGLNYGRLYYLPEFYAHTPAGNLRFSRFLSADDDMQGNIYVVWHDCKFRSNCSANDIVLTTSTDGRQWTTLERVPIDAVTSTADHFMPGIAVEPGTSGSTAHLAVTFWAYPEASCTETTCLLSVGEIESPDGGQTWGRAIPLAGPFHNTWLPLTSDGYMVGDYSSISFVPDGALTVFAVARDSPCQLSENNCLEAMAAPRAPLRPVLSERTGPSKAL